MICAVFIHILLTYILTYYWFIIIETKVKGQPCSIGNGKAVLEVGNFSRSSTLTAALATQSSIQTVPSDAAYTTAGVHPI